MKLIKLQIRYPFRISTLFFSFCISSIAVSQSILKSHEDITKSLFQQVSSQGLSQRNIDWIFTLIGNDSIVLEFTSAVLLQNFEKAVKSRLFKDLEYFPEQSNYLVEIISEDTFSEKELRKKANSISKSLRRSSIKLASIGYEIKNPKSSLLESVNERISQEKSLSSKATISGQIIDQRTKKPIPFVSISFKNKNSNISTDINGEFHSNINYLLTDSIVISAAGYKKRVISAVELKQKIQLGLHKDYKLLDQVVIEGNFTGKKIIMGQKKIGLLGKAAFIDGEFGEAAKKIDPKGKLVYLNEINFFVSNRMKSPFVFILRIYELNDNQMPGGNLLKEKVSILDSLEKGWVKVNMNKYNLVFDKPFFVGIQWTIKKYTPSITPPMIGIRGSSAFIRSSQTEMWEETDFYSWIINVEGTIFGNR